jgi:hypothetical protein
MNIGDAFRQLAQRIMSASKKGGLSRTELKKLDHLLARTGKRNAILAKGILTALDAGGATRADISRFGELLGKANQRILEDKEPFTPKESSELTSIFRRAYVSRKTSGWFSSHLDELLAQEINESIKGERGLAVPKKTGQEAAVVKEERKKLKA